MPKQPFTRDHQREEDLCAMAALLGMRLRFHGDDQAHGDWDADLCLDQSAKDWHWDEYVYFSYDDQCLWRSGHGGRARKLSVSDFYPAVEEMIMRSARREG